MQNATPRRADPARRGSGFAARVRRRRLRDLFLLPPAPDVRQQRVDAELAQLLAALAEEALEAGDQPRAQVDALPLEVPPAAGGFAQARGVEVLLDDQGLDRGDDGGQLAVVVAEVRELLEARRDRAGSSRG